MPFILILYLKYFTTQMKKNSSFVLFLPIVAYLSFALSERFYNITSYNPSVPDLGKWESLNGETVTLNGNITILGFSGSDILKKRKFF
jgi:hypothetical protein